MTQTGHFLFWWEWVDSNHLRLKPTDLQSAPALQLRRTPRTFCASLLSQMHDTGFLALAIASVKIRGAGSGTRTRISSLEGLRTSPCTMPAKGHWIILYIYQKASIYLWCVAYCLLILHNYRTLTLAQILAI